MIFIVAAVAVLGFLIHFRAKIQVWTFYVALLLIFWTYKAGGFGRTEYGYVWIAFLILALLVNVPSIRRVLFIKPVYRLFRKMLPPISRTEREALEAGTVWWDGELFTGDPDWNKLLNLPPSKLSADEESFLNDTVDELCRLLDDYKINEDRDLSPEAWQFIREKGFFGMIIPKEYGGLGFSTLAHSQVVTKIASRSVTAAVTVMVPNSLGPAELLQHYGTEEQKQYYLPRLARGEEVPCFALTGPEAGSDAASLPDTGIVCRGTFRGEEIVGIRLNWEKRYITLGPVATLLGLAFQLKDPERLLGSDIEPGITMALVPADTEGIHIGHRHDPLGVSFQNGPNSGKDVFIPIEWVVGGKSGIGRGWQMLMECLAAGRCVSLPALSTGVGKFTERAVGAYARIRRQFRLPIGRFEGIEAVLARIAGSVYIMDAARTVTCGAVDAGEKPSVISAIIKYYCTEQMRKVVNDSMDVLGGSGICLGPKNLLGRFYQAAPIGITVEGANILTRSMIIFGQGAIRCHPSLLKEMIAAGQTDATRGLAEGGLKRKERISARLADILIHLYLLSALLKRYEDRNAPKDEFPLLQWGCETCLHAIQESFKELFINLPNRPVAWLLRLTIFPLGGTYRHPGDRLGSRIARILTEPSELRDRLSEEIFIPSDPSDPFGCLEDALQKVVAAEPVERKLRDAVRQGSLEEQPESLLTDAGVRSGVITEDEAKRIREAEIARRKVIEVDAYPSLKRFQP
ncbi:MAG: acyl-CoA dehydrogenase [Acidobacteriota bacterium]